MSFTRPLRLTLITALSLSLAAALTLAGCSNTGPLDDATFDAWPTHDAALNTMRDHLADAVRTPAASSASSSSAAPTSDPLTPASGPEDYVRLALKLNPRLAAAREKVLRLAERVPQATSLDDPMFQVAPIGEMAETAAGQVGLMTGISQKLPTPGKLSTRGRIVAHDAAVAADEYRAAAVDVTADTRRAFWSLYFNARAIEVAQSNRDVIAGFRDIANAKFQAGKARQTDVLRASVDLSTIDNQLLTLKQQRDAAVAMLDSLLNRPVTTSLPDPAPIEPADHKLDLDALLAEAARTNPQIAQVRQRIDAARQRVHLSKLNRWPDLTVSANYAAVDDSGLSRVANGKDQWYIGFGINLPVWTNRLDAAEREARRDVLEELSQLKAADNRVAYQVADAFSRVESDQHTVALMRDVIVPQAKQVVDASLSGYRAGDIDFLTLSDNQQKLLNFQLAYHRSVANLQQDLADLHRAIGRDDDAASHRPRHNTPQESHHD